MRADLVAHGTEFAEFGCAERTPARQDEEGRCHVAGSERAGSGELAARTIVEGDDDRSFGQWTIGQERLESLFERDGDVAVGEEPIELLLEAPEGDAVAGGWLADIVVHEHRQAESAREEGRIVVGHAGLAGDGSGLDAIAGCELGTEASQLDLPERAERLGVPREAGALEVLDGDGLAGFRIDFGEFLGDRVTEDGEAAIAEPEAEETVGEEMAGFREEAAKRRRWRRIQCERREGRIVAPRGEQGSDPSELDGASRISGAFGQCLQASPLEVLDE